MPISTPTHLHVVAFDLPYPPDYGGAIDVYYKLKALHRLGVSVVLHAFLYGKKRQTDTPLAEFCTQIYTYPRLSAMQSRIGQYPYIVGSRRSDDLWRNLCADQCPILFEGLHTCAYLPQARAAGRVAMVRMHNIEADYYASLYRSSSWGLKKIYYGAEAMLLHRYERVLSYADVVWAISPADTAYLQQYYPTRYLPAFHAYDAPVSQLGKGNYALYHANLGVRENEIAALFLLREVFSLGSSLPLRLVIAGKNPTIALQKAIAQCPNALLLPNPDADYMRQLIADAQVQLLPTFQATGIKLKLLESLFNGRFCLANTPMVAQTGLEDLCIVADTASDFVAALHRIADMPFTEAHRDHRRQVLSRLFDNAQGAAQLWQTACG